jgi:hypothetical protein
LKKTTKATALAAGTLAGLFAGASNASADTIFERASQSARDNGETVGATGEVAKQQLELKQLIAANKYINPKGLTGDAIVVGKDMTLDELKAAAARVRKVNDLLDEAERKGVRVSSATYALPTNSAELNHALDGVIDSVEAEVSKLEEGNRETLNQDLLDSANRTLAKASATQTNSETGALGNMREIARAAHDSAQEGTIKANKVVVDDKGRPTDEVRQENKPGIIVDTTATNKVSTTTTVETPIDEYVRTNSEIIAKRDELLKTIKAAGEHNRAQVAQSSDYKRNALANIASSNAWLQKEQDRADNIQTEIKKNSTVLKTMENYRTESLAKLAKARDLVAKHEKLKPAIKAKILEAITKAEENLNASVVNITIANSVKSIDADFGDIGQDPALIKAEQDKASKAIDGVIEKALEDLRESNKEAEKAIEADIETNVKSIDGLLKSLEKASGATQIDENFLNTRPIYKDGTATYKAMIDKALKQSELSDSIFTSETKDWSGNVTIKQLKKDTPVATAAASEYLAQVAAGNTNGFGSVMVPSKNINDFATAVGGRRLANSQTFAGGTQGLYDYIRRNYITLGGLGDHPVLKDLKTQHIDKVGAKNVFLMASDKPDFTFKLKDSFVYVNEAGETKTADTFVHLQIKAFSTQRIKNLDYTGAKTLFLAYMSIDPDTGVVTTGAGYIFGLGRGAWNGTGGSGNAGGEMRLGEFKGEADDNGTIQQFMSDGFASPVGFEGTPEWNQGLYLQIDAAVSPEAQKYASHSPLYVSDLDDGQVLYMSTDEKSDIILPEGGVSTYKSWVTSGDAVAIKPANVGKTSANNGILDIDNQSVMVFGGADNPNLTPKEFGIGRGGNYQSIDISLFAPFGIVGQPTVNVKTLETTLKSFTLEDPKAKAHTQGQYNMKHVTAHIQAAPTEAGTVPVPRPALRVEEPSIVNKHVASGNSIAIRKLQDAATRTASGNSFVVRTLEDVKRVSSGNSFVVRTFENKSVRTASGNSFTVRTLPNTSTAAASGNSFVVRTDNKPTLDHDHHDHDHDHSSK